MFPLYITNKVFTAVDLLPGVVHYIYIHVCYHFKYSRLNLIVKIFTLRLKTR